MSSPGEKEKLALARERLGQLVDELQADAGPASAQAYERVLAQWFGPAGPVAGGRAGQRGTAGRGQE